MILKGRIKKNENMASTNDIRCDRCCKYWEHRYMLEFWSGKYVTTLCIFCENDMPPCQRCKYPLVCVRDNDEDEDDVCCEDCECQDVYCKVCDKYSILIEGQIPENHILFCTSCEKKAYCEKCNDDNDVKLFYNNREIEFYCSSCF